MRKNNLFPFHIRQIMKNPVFIIFTIGFVWIFYNYYTLDKRRKYFKVVPAHIYKCSNFSMLSRKQYYWYKFTYYGKEFENRDFLKAYDKLDCDCAFNSNFFVVIDSLNPKFNFLIKSIFLSKKYLNIDTVSCFKEDVTFDEMYN